MSDKFKETNEGKIENMIEKMGKNSQSFQGKKCVGKQK